MTDITDFIQQFIEESFPVFLGMGIGLMILIIVLGILAVLLVNALFLRIALAIRKVPTTYATCLGTTFYMLLFGLCALIPFVGIFIMFFLHLWIISKRHFMEYFNAFLIWLIAILLPYGILAIILVLNGTIAVLI